MNQTIVALYEDMDNARKAVEALRDQGVPMSAVSIVAHNVDGRHGNGHGNGQVVDAQVVDAKDVEKLDGAASGVAVGAALGGLGGLLIGIGALFIPGIGPVVAAGPLSAALAGLAGAGAGAVAGGVTGGLIGALVDAGIPEEQAHYYGEGVRRGGALVSATVSDDQAAQVRGVLDRYDPVDLTSRVDEWRRTGWNGYDDKAQPYTSEQVLEERDAYRVR